jgi:hypothetical protein
MDEEDPSLYYVLNLHKRRDTREMQQIQDTDGTTHTTYRDIVATFVKHLVQKFGPLEVDPQALTTVLQHIRPIDPQTFAAHLEKPTTIYEVIRALHAGTRRKTPGRDRICLEFYITQWETIQAELTHLVNDMFLNKCITGQQKQGILTCLPKSQPSSTPDTYRPISLLNTDHKLLAHIMAHRLKPSLAEKLSTGQQCGIPGRSILDTLASVRDFIVRVYHETTQTTFCLLSLDFRQAFDRVSHDYLFQELLRYGIKYMVRGETASHV